MPIKIPDNLPARKYLQQEGLMVMRQSDAMRQDIRPIRIALLNLMPLKEKTEMQFARLVGATPLQVEMSLLTTGSYTPGHVSAEHMLDFYRPWHDVKEEKYDGLIVTGAPVETMPFRDVAYWPELEAIYDWTQTNVFSTLNICWGAQASLYHFHGVEKHMLPQKMFGVFPHKIVKRNSVLLRGFPEEFPVPVSRYTEVRREDLPSGDVEILATSDEAGLCLLRERKRRQIYMFNHLEYDAETLKEEYERDLARGLPIAPPENYFPDGDSSRTPINSWRSQAHLLIANWINDVYQHTPFDIRRIGEGANA